VENSRSAALDGATQRGEAATNPRGTTQEHAARGTIPFQNGKNTKRIDEGETGTAASACHELAGSPDGENGVEKRLPLMNTTARETEAH